MNDLNKEISSKGLIRVLKVIMVFAVISVFIVVGFYFSNFNKGLSNDQAIWGTFGDFFGGTLNPILSFLSLIALLLTIILQNKELQATRQELRQSREAQEEQTKSFQTQLKLLEQKDKRDLTFQMLERWTNSNMRTHRLNAWNYLEDKFNGKNIDLNLDEFRNKDIGSFESFTEICQFLSDLNKILSENLLDKELTIILFNDSVYPWFRYTNNIVFDNLESESKKMNYTKKVKSWYETKVMTLKNHFDSQKNEQ